MLKGLRRRGVRVLLIAGAILAGAAGIALATIPGSTGVINGCFDKRKGDLRVIDTEAGKTCATSETPISWNERGERGAQGDTGPRGETGPPGESGKLALAGESCPEGEFVRGFDSAGDLICASGTDPGALIVEPYVQYFEAAVSFPTTETISFTNAGDLPVVPMVPAFSGSGEFQVVAPLTCSSNGLAPKATCQVNVRFQPPAPGTYVETLFVGGIGIKVVGVGVAG